MVSTRLCGSSRVSREKGGVELLLLPAASKSDTSRAESLFFDRVRCFTQGGTRGSLSPGSRCTRPPSSLDARTSSLRLPANKEEKSSAGTPCRQLPVKSMDATLMEVSAQSREQALCSSRGHCSGSDDK